MASHINVAKSKLGKKKKTYRNPRPYHLANKHWLQSSLAVSHTKYTAIFKHQQKAETDSFLMVPGILKEMFKQLKDFYRLLN